VTSPANKEDDEDSEVEMEEVSGYHFMDCMPLFVSYVYVTSGSHQLAIPRLHFLPGVNAVGLLCLLRNTATV